MQRCGASREADTKKTLNFSLFPIFQCRFRLLYHKKSGRNWEFSRMHKWKDLESAEWYNIITHCPFLNGSVTGHQNYMFRSLLHQAHCRRKWPRSVAMLGHFLVSAQLLPRAPLESNYFERVPFLCNRMKRKENLWKHNGYCNPLCTSFMNDFVDDRVFVKSHDESESSPCAHKNILGSTTTQQVSRLHTTLSSENVLRLKDNLGPLCFDKQFHGSSTRFLPRKPFTSDLAGECYSVVTPLQSPHRETSRSVKQGFFENKIWV